MNAYEISFKLDIYKPSFGNNIEAIRVNAKTMEEAEEKARAILDNRHPGNTAYWCGSKLL